MPPFLPSALVAELGLVDAFRALPAIENIEIEPPYQKQGIFMFLAHEMAQLSFVRGVVVSNVINVEFAEALSRRCGTPGSHSSRFEREVSMPWAGLELPSFLFSPAGMVKSELVVR